jgi:RHS repeat-associated protein
VLSHTRYDDLDRLWKSADLAGSPLYTYSYDANGNRTQEIAPAGTTTYSYASATDQLTQASGANAKHYAHDAYGSRIWAGPTAYASSPSHVYNELNRLVEVRDPGTQAVLGQYTYDAFGRRVRKVTASGTTLFFYDPAGHLLEERSLATTPNTVRDYVFLEDEPIGLVDMPPSGSPAFAWIHTDRLGTPLAVTSSPAAGAPQTIWRASYAPFGQAAVNADPDGDTVPFTLDLRFPGQVYDAESGQHYNFFRDYDPAMGRYLQSDPIGVAVGLNTFAYLSSNPVMRVDLLGLDASSASAAASGADALRLFRPYQRGKEAAERAASEGATEGQWDAIQHCVASCEGTREWGEANARNAGAWNEIVGILSAPPSTQGDYVMDTHNNRKGRQLAQKNPCTDCYEGCRDLLRAGTLNDRLKGFGREFRWGGAP